MYLAGAVGLLFRCCLDEGFDLLTTCVNGIEQWKLRSVTVKAAGIVHLWYQAGIGKPRLVAIAEVAVLLMFN